ncbi:MAG: DNA-directed polymerase subunit sigma-24 [Sediminibacterium sp.]|nr:DNA-directed polymerase subunit sigma-24 [Sediminibacterium sp.]
MLKVKNGDLDRMGLLFERYHSQLFGFLFHMTGQRELSEDLVQNVFYRMLKYRHTFRGDGEFRAWMYHVARNVIHDQGRSSKRSVREYELDEQAERIGGGPMADEPIQKKQELRALQAALARLQVESREVLILSRYQELKYHEIASIMNITEGAVKVRVHRALHQLKNIYLKIESNEM